MKLDSKVPFYNLVNILLTGLVFIGSVAFLFINEIQEYINNITTIGSTGLETILTISCFAIAYELGYIIFRLGAVIIEPIAKTTIKFAPYSDFIAAQKIYPKLEDISREYGYARTRIMLFTLISILAWIKSVWWLLGISVIFILLFIITLVTHTNKIKASVKKYLSELNPDASSVQADEMKAYNLERK